MKTAPYQVFAYPVILFQCFIVSFAPAETAAGEMSKNILPGKAAHSVLLEHWQIARDPASEGALPIIPDSSWKPFIPYSGNDRYSEGNWLFKTTLRIEDSSQSEIIWGLFPRNFLSAYEIYWDGEKIGQNGVIGANKGKELPGAFNFDLPLPSRLMTPGNHAVLMRISNYHDDSRMKWFYGTLLIGQYSVELKKIFQSRYRAFFVGGIMLIPLFFNLFLYFVRKGRIEHLLFSIICLIVIADFLADQITLFINVDTTYIHWEAYLYRANTITVSFLFPVFFIQTFSFPKRTVLLIVLVNLVIYIFFTDFWNTFTVSHLTMLILSGFITVTALLLRREGSIIIFSGLILTLGAYVYGVPFAGLATIMAICTSFSIARQFAGKEKAEREAKLRSVHLENELLKKNINPHFLLNSLTSIIAWLRKDPKTAVKLIEALADEFKMITQISSQALIPIQQEIELCRAHLKIMSYRKGTEFNLIAKDIDQEESVPPMMFHTVIENGLTHGYENKTKGTFTLQRKQTADGVLYIISNDGNFIRERERKSNGLGMQYIKARLEESFPNRWKIDSYHDAKGWSVNIEIRKS